MATTVKSQKSAETKKPILSVKPKISSTSSPNQDYQDYQDYQEMIAEAAYYKAEQRGFVPGFEQEDWLAAESEIHSMLDLH